MSALGGSGKSGGSNGGNGGRAWTPGGTFIYPQERKVPPSSVDTDDNSPFGFFLDEGETPTNKRKIRHRGSKKEGGYF